MKRITIDIDKCCDCDHFEREWWGRGRWYCGVTGEDIPDAGILETCPLPDAPEPLPLPLPLPIDEPMPTALSVLIMIFFLAATVAIIMEAIA